MLADDREICTARGSPESQSAMTGSIEMMEDRSSARISLVTFAFHGAMRVTNYQVLPWI